MSTRSGDQPAFGLFDYTMVPKIRRLLKPFGLDLKVKTDRQNWGDQVEVTVVEAKPKRTQRGRHSGTITGGRAGRRPPLLG